MNLKTAIITCLKEKYGLPTGRASRSEFWFFTLFYLFTMGLSTYIFALINLPEEIVGEVLGIIFIMLTVAHSSAAARRLHDIDSSGWWQFIVFIPYIGLIILYIFLVFKGTEGENQFGPPVV